jgi:hypothetical protein
MQEVRMIKCVAAAWISNYRNYYLSQNTIALVQPNRALHKYASPQQVPN